MSEPNFPQHDKLMQIKDEKQNVGDFIEWMKEQNIVLCRFEAHQHDDGCYDSDDDQICGFYKGQEIYMPINRSRDNLMAEYFDIDLDELEREKRRMLDDLRKSA